MRNIELVRIGRIVEISVAYTAHEKMLLQALAQEHAEIICLREECPGVYYLAVQNENSAICQEFYTVMSDAIAAVISQETLSYGKKSGDIYMFEKGPARSGYELVEYELRRYRVKKKLHAPDDLESIYCKAVYTAELYPEYFGGLLPPRSTPFGLTVRTKKAGEGVYFVETTQCIWLLALAYPVWDGDLSSYAKNLAEQYESCESKEAPEAEYYFYRLERSLPVLYELLALEEYQGLLQFITGKETLEALLYQKFSKYVLSHNMMQSIMESKCRELLEELEELGIQRSEAEQAAWQDRCIHLNPELAGRPLFLLP